MKFLITFLYLRLKIFTFKKVYYCAKSHLISKAMRMMTIILTLINFNISTGGFKALNKFFAIILRNNCSI